MEYGLIPGIAIGALMNVLLICSWLLVAKKLRNLQALYDQGYYFMETHYYRRVNWIPIHPRFIDTTTGPPRLMTGYSYFPQAPLFGRYNNPYL